MRTIKFVAIIYFLIFLLSSCKLSDSGNEQEQVLYNIPQIETSTSSFQIIENNKIKLPTLSVCFPDNYEISSINGEAVLQNKNKSIQITVEDKTSEIQNFDDYIQDTINSLKQLGLSPQTVETVNLGKCFGQRFTVDTYDITNSKIRMFCYFLEVNNSKILINVISSNGEIIETRSADSLVAEIKFE